MNPASERTLYDLLDVAPDADPDRVRTAYRRAARRHHPDTGGDEREMSDLNRAWAILRDPARRRAYDRQRLGLAPEPSASPAAQPDAGERAQAQAPAAAPQQPIATPVGRASGTVIDFGRYVGWSIGQLVHHDPDYLHWLARTPVGRPLRPEIQLALATKGETL